MTSLRRSTVALLGGVLALTTGFLLAIPGSLASASTGSSSVKTITSRQTLYDVGVKHTVPQGEIPMVKTSFTKFTAKVTDGGHTYTYTMAGKNPAKAVTNPSAKIKTFLIPVDMVIPGHGTWDPTVGDNCDPAGQSALTRTKASPIFVSQAWTWGGTSIGTGQVTDAFQRANFWKFAGPTGINPTYGVNLSMKVLPEVTINVPLADAATASISCGNGLLGAADINWLDPYIQSTLIPSLASEGVTSTTLPIFLLHNFVEYQGNTSNCCILGYHNAYSSPVQTYALSMYDNTSAFTGSSDISGLSHEVAEWMDDPYTNNPTAKWGHIGQVSGCQANLEVGDPLSGTTFADPVGGFTYHPQQLAFFSWFYHQSPSIGVNGWYSDQGTFTSPAAACT
jgi:hypothetical protein